MRKEGRGHGKTDQVSLDQLLGWGPEINPQRGRCKTQRRAAVGAVYDRAFCRIKEICAVTDRAYNSNRSPLAHTPRSSVALHRARSRVKVPHSITGKKKHL